MAIDARDAREFFLIPAALFDQTRDLGRKFGGFGWRAFFHAMILPAGPAWEQMQAAAVLCK